MKKSIGMMIAGILCLAIAAQRGCDQPPEPEMTVEEQMRYERMIW